MRRIAVIGGGMAGLSAAYELLRLGAEPVVFEASSRAGGVVGSVREGPWLTEDGPNFIAQPMDALLDAAGLEVVFPSPPKTRWVWWKGQRLRAPSLGLLRHLGVGRALLEPLVARGLFSTRAGASSPEGGGDPSLRDFLVGRLGERAGGLLSTLMASGVYAGDATQLSARSAFPTMACGGSLLLRRGRRPPIWSLREGLGSLPAALAARLGDRVRLQTPVRRLSAAASGWLVEGEQFDGVLLCVPASSAVRLIPQLASELSSLRSAPVVVVHLGFPARELPRGFGLLDASGSLRFLGALLPSSMLPGRAPDGSALVTAICGGARNPGLLRLADAELVEAVSSDLRTTLGVRSPCSYKRVVRYEEAIPQYEIGHAGRMLALRARLAEFPALELAGAAYDGVSVPDVARSGAAAAARLLAMIKH